MEPLHWTADALVIITNPCPTGFIKKKKKHINIYLYFISHFDAQIVQMAENPFQ